jgi:hypothetical protein
MPERVFPPDRCQAYQGNGKCKFDCQLHKEWGKDKLLVCCYACKEKGKCPYKCNKENPVAEGAVA